MSADSFSPAMRWGRLVRPRSRLGRLAAGLLTAAALSFAAPHAKAALTIHKGVLTVGAQAAYPPYIYLVNHKVMGFGAEFSRLLAKDMGLQVKFVNTQFAQLILGLRANRFDVVVSALYVTPERAKIIAYVPYLKTGDSLLVLKDSTNAPSELAQLCGMKVSSIQGASWIPKLAKVSAEDCVAKGKSPLKVLEFPTSPGALMALKSKAVDVMIEDAAVAHYMIENEKQGVRVSSTSLLYPIVIGIGVSKDKPELKEALERALEKAKKSGEYEALVKKYGLAAPTKEDVVAALQPK